jgi:hypothetical protein
VRPRTLFICTGKLRNFLFCLLLVAGPGAAAASSAECSGVDRTVTEETKARLAPLVAAQLETPTDTGQLKVSTVDVLESFRSRAWTILYVDTHTSDNAFLFYRESATGARFVTLWAGAARSDEQRQIRQWVQKNAPGIPTRLANCFAWHVTQDRDK